MPLVAVSQGGGSGASGRAIASARSGVRTQADTTKLAKWGLCGGGSRPGPRRKCTNQVRAQLKYVRVPPRSGSSGLFLALTWAWIVPTKDRPGGGSTTKGQRWQKDGTAKARNALETPCSQRPQPQATECHNQPRKTGISRKGATGKHRGVGARRCSVQKGATSRCRCSQSPIG